MKNKGKKILTFLKQNVRIKVIILTLTLGLFFSFLGMSYALFVVSNERSNLFHIVVGKLNYKLSISSLSSNKNGEILDDNTIQIYGGNSLFIVDIVIESTNPIDSNYQLYYTGNISPQATIYHLEETEETTGSIGKVGTKKNITLVIKNRSTDFFQIHLDIVGGLLGKPLSIPKEGQRITQKIKYLYDRTGNQYSSKTGGWNRSLTEAGDYYKGGTFPLDIVTNSAGNTLIYGMVTSSNQYPELRKVYSLAPNNQIDLTGYTKLYFTYAGGAGVNYLEFGCYTEFINLHSLPAIVREKVTGTYDTYQTVTIDITNRNISCYPGIIFWSSESSPETNSFLSVIDVWLE